MNVKTGNIVAKTHVVIQLTICNDLNNKNPWNIHDIVRSYVATEQFIS